MNRPFRIAMLGKQGAGKGTQCARISEEFSIPHISTGDMLRQAVKAGTEFGLKAAEYMERGDLVPDEVIIGTVVERLGQEDAVDSGYLLDGFPRTLAQAKALDSAIDGALKLVINLEVDTEIVLERLSSRRVCEGCGRTYSTSNPPSSGWVCDTCGGDVVQRADDTPEAISRRLAIYDELTAPLIGWYSEKGILVTVEGSGDLDLVTSNIVQSIQSVAL